MELERTVNIHQYDTGVEIRNGELGNVEDGTCSCGNYVYEGIQCDECDAWFHFSCASIGQDDRNNIKQIIWLCKGC